MTGVVTPLVYYAGIEDNQKKVKEYLLASLEKVNKSDKQIDSEKMSNKKNLTHKTTPVEEINLSHINF